MKSSHTHEIDCGLQALALQGLFACCSLEDASHANYSVKHLLCHEELIAAKENGYREYETAYVVEG